ncbi:MAG: glutamate mutase L [bacterium]|nr:glutamate mutase L [bacterium]MBK8127445.1 glutamate mutase L [bacterium]
MKKPSDITTILATDCGSTTTKAILIEKQGDEYRLVCRGEAPTTVEAPFEDVTKGVLNAISEIGEIMGREFTEKDGIIKTKSGDRGCDIYISTSSAGGGLQMMVSGVVKAMTAESAERAALGAGAIVMDTLASNDGRLPHQKIERIRKLRPDMILLSGGVDGGTTKHVIELAELLKAARPRPRLGSSYKLPVIYAGNKEARDDIKNVLGDEVDLLVVDNLRPVLERENLGPARDAIHDLFMEHVMAQAPGYRKLMAWSDAPIMPTPGAVGDIMQRVAKARDITLVGVDIGGATTDVFSIFRVPGSETKETVFNRTVSANLGMSYSVMNVLAEAGIENIMRWVPFVIDERELRNRIANKMIRPTTIPQTKEELQIEQAISREALRLAFVQHKNFATSLKGIQQERTISDTFDQSGSGETVVNMMSLNIIVGSGGVLSHAPRRSQAAHMMMDAFQPEGVTELAVDSIFMMPHLGVLASVHEQAAIQVFEKDCLVRLGSCVCPVGKSKEGKPCVTITGTSKSGQAFNQSVPFGELLLFPLAPGDEIKATIKPEKGFDVGAGSGKEIQATLHGGVVGLLIDTRGRPLDLSPQTENRVAKIQKWTKIQDFILADAHDDGVATVRKGT